MTSATDPHPDLLAEPSARTFPLAQLVSLIREGKVRIPHFQRGLRWGKSDAVALIDSVLRGFPIGSLLLWRRRAPAETIRLGNVEINAPEQSDALYVVDGQQRLTTFLNVFDPRHGLEGEFALVYDLRTRPFKVRARTGNESDAHIIPLPVLFDLGKLLTWTRDRPQYLDQIDEINSATQRLREFHVPAYEVRSQDDRVLREIYDRMNRAPGPKPSAGSSLPRKALRTPPPSKPSKPISAIAFNGVSSIWTPFCMPSSPAGARTCIGISTSSSARNVAGSRSSLMRIASNPISGHWMLWKSPSISCATKQVCPISPSWRIAISWWF